ncbi:hypothetical protein BGZ61DRAFT_454798 [Ilyonectria robusta]|uniref:uncharacterized protein n=1 Tax=Ilyonectria robusta TaxID=1079257 RepID=UPI001E8DF394|nr:uncharacterized protein BGZ61DRAFT_454798 [Ilyonectria robusta]KAH8684959.1 hypothetical protein BGZ61DRAFT_454798 [Ilyonectria robusta]
MIEACRPVKCRGVKRGRRPGWSGSMNTPGTESSFRTYSALGSAASDQSRAISAEACSQDSPERRLGRIGE